jgi:hypothetical protein
MQTPNLVPIQSHYQNVILEYPVGILSVYRW